MNNAAIGVDIGGTNTKYGIVSTEGVVLFENSISTSDFNQVEELANYIFNSIQESKLKLNKDITINAIGIGAPNANHLSGYIEYAPNLKWKKLVPIVNIFKEVFSTPTFLTNDANVVAIGEMSFGIAKNIKDFIVITLGTGLGSAIVSDGQLIYGHDGFAGELGHTTIFDHNARECSCGKYGCLEAYVSSQGMRRSSFEIMCNSNTHSELRDISFNNITPKIIHQAAKRGDPIAIQTFEMTGDILGKFLANSISYTSPKAIILFGGLTYAKELIMKPTIKSMEQSLLAIYKNKVNLILSTSGANMAIIGAATMSLKAIK